jgi:hypothetical protein
MSLKFGDQHWCVPYVSPCGPGMPAASLSCRVQSWPSSRMPAVSPDSFHLTGPFHRRGDALSPCVNRPSSHFAANHRASRMGKPSAPACREKPGSTWWTCIQGPRWLFTTTLLDACMAPWCGHVAPYQDEAEFKLPTESELNPCLLASRQSGYYCQNANMSFWVCKDQSELTNCDSLV